jgi:hypothetical protein
VRRDNKELSRLSELKEKNILHLEIEEELFKTFAKFKREKVTPTIKKLIESDHKIPGKSTRDICDAFEKSLTDRWAFWLDENKSQIEKIKSSSEKADMINSFKKRHSSKRLQKLWIPVQASKACSIRLLTSLKKR